jgi:hypothetical protein
MKFFRSVTIPVLRASHSALVSSVSTSVHPWLNPSPASAQNRTFPSRFAPMCTSVHLCAPLCGKTKKFKMVHKPHTTAHLKVHLANLHQLAEKDFAQAARFNDMKVRFFFSL